MFLRRPIYRSGAPSCVPESYTNDTERYINYTKDPSQPTHSESPNSARCLYMGVIWLYFYSFICLWWFAVISQRCFSHLENFSPEKKKQFAIKIWTSIICFIALTPPKILCAFMERSFFHTVWLQNKILSWLLLNFCRYWVNCSGIGNGWYSRLFG